MEYQSLSKLYYKNPQAYTEEYNKRLHSFNTRVLDIQIQQYNYQKAYPAFFYYTDELILLMEKIYRASEHLSQVTCSVPTIVLRQFSLTSILEEVKSTNDIEGVHSTRKELKEILDGAASRSARFYSIVHKYSSLLKNEEIEFATNQAIRDFYDDFAHEETVEEDPQNKLDGKIFRKDPVDIIGSSGKIIHRGISPEADLLVAMQNALDVLHDDSIPFLVRVSVFHYLFAYIHPFYDGNGRTDRFIVSYYLSKHFNSIVALRLSVLIKKNKKKYYSLFSEADSEINRGDLTPFVMGFLTLLLKTFEDTVVTLERKQKQLEAYEEKLKRLDLQDELLEEIYNILLQAALFYGRGVSINELVEFTGRSRNTIQKRLDTIAQDKLITVKYGKTKYYKLNLLMFK